MGSEISFAPPRLTKGRFTIARTGEFRSFSLNPNDLTDARGYGYGSVTVPGISHPVIQAGSGTERVIGFTLRLDGDVGYRGIRRTAQTSRNTAGRDPTLPGAEPVSLSVVDEIAWYRQFTYSEGNARLGQPGSQPDIILFSFGPLYQGMRCVLRNAPFKVLKWSPSLEPICVDLTIELVEKVNATVPRSSIWSAGRNREF